MEGDGELIDRLVEAISTDEDWREIGWLLSFAIGGTLRGIEPELDREPPPGSVAEIRTASANVMPRASYLVAIKERLWELAKSGVREDFLVRALREEIRVRLAEFAFGSGSRREQAATVLDDFDVESFREFMAENNPLAQYLRDDEVQAELDELREMVRPNPAAIDAAKRRADRWDVAAAGDLSDVVLQEWLTRRSSPTE